MGSLDRLLDNYERLTANYRPTLGGERFFTDKEVSARLANRGFIPVKVRVQLRTQLPGIQREDQRLLPGVFLDFVFHRFLPVLLILLSGRQTMPYSSLFQVLRLRTVSPAVFSN